MPPRFGVTTSHAELGALDKANVFDLEYVVDKSVTDPDPRSIHNNPRTDWDEKGTFDLLGRIAAATLPNGTAIIEHIDVKTPKRRWWSR